MLKESQIWTALRLGMGWMFLWAFFDKLFGLGFATTPDKAWLAGGSPTTGFLAHAVKGPLAPFFNSLSGNVLIDWWLMISFLFLGISLMLGIFRKLSGYYGALVMLTFWLALIPPQNNPFLDEHIIFIIVLLGLAIKPATFGLGKWWTRQKLAKKYKILE
ncbi:hypothetical protein EPN87_00955 [archaeon]|nr:MAG: hypothetical protein EPN87_00955 [archaeon]